MEKTDEQIMLEYQSGDDQSVNLIFHRYKSRIINYCYKILGNRADAEDVTGDVFVALFSKKYTFSPHAKFSTWLYTVAHNSCITRIRKRKRLVKMWFTSKNSGVEEQWDIPDPSHISREELEIKERKAHVQKAIAALPVSQREALVLREYDRMSYQEISDILNCSLAQVKILIYRAREHLKGSLNSLILGDE